MATASPTAERLTQKQKELVAVAAALGAGCIPCTQHHAGAVREAGASEEETAWAAAIGLRVKRESLAIMAALAAERLALPLPDGAITDGRADTDETALGALVAIAAATAAHCAPALEREIAAARRLGASDDNITRAFRIGRKVREVGASKADEAAERMIGLAGDRS